VEGTIVEVTRLIALAINMIAVVIVVVGVVVAVVGLLRLQIAGTATLVAMRGLWMDFARVLIAGLTFQLAADVVETAISPSWEDLGKFAAIAAIRLLLSYSLDRDMTAIGERQRADEERIARGHGGSTGA